MVKSFPEFRTKRGVEIFGRGFNFLDAAYRPEKGDSGPLLNGEMQAGGLCLLFSSGKHLQANDFENGPVVPGGILRSSGDLGKIELRLQALGGGTQALAAAGGGVPLFIGGAVLLAKLFKLF